MRTNFRSVLIAMIILSSHQLSLAQAADSDLAKPRTVTSLDAFDNLEDSAEVYARTAAYDLKHEDFDKAIKLCQLALNKEDDTEYHKLYAEALEAKLRRQVDKDPTLYQSCVTQWLLVLRQSGGDENLAYHGVGVPGLGKFFGDEDAVIPARNHILQLTGHLPKVWETNDKFIHRIMKGANAKVSGAIIHNATK